MAFAELAAVTWLEAIFGLTQFVGTAQFAPRLLELARLKLSEAGIHGAAEGDALGLALGEALDDGDTLKLMEGDTDGLADSETLGEALGLTEGE